MSEQIRLPPMLSERQLRELVRDAIELRRHALVFQAAEIWSELLEGVSPRGAIAEVAPRWQPIASLSQLRGVVGVRFQKLRDRWVAAGFPLREHRGDRPIRPDVALEAWEDFARWLQDEGYRVRRSEAGAEAFFEISPMTSEANER